ncbi:MAG: hypothetical protein V3W41_22110 [Planctomycetota bacterium]
MASNADFTIDGDAHANRGFDALNSEVLTLQIEDSPALDVRTTVFSVVQKTLGAPDIAELGAVGGAGASPSPNPQDGLDITMPAAGVQSYIIRCQINGGKDTGGNTIAEWTTEREVAIRTSNNLRKIVPVETDQYDPTYGWTESWNDGIDLLASVVTGTGTDDHIMLWDGTTDAKDSLVSITGAGDLVVDADVVTPIVQQADESVGVAGDQLTTHAQNVTTGAGTKTAGPLSMEGGACTGAGTSNTGGFAIVLGGSASGGSANVGGNAFVQGGVGATTPGAAAIRDSTGANRVLVGTAGDVVVDGPVFVDLQIGAASRVGVTNTVVELGAATCQFDVAVVTPVVKHETDPTATAGDLLTVSAQDLDTATGAKVAGAFLSRGGDCADGTTNVGGAYSARAGIGATTVGLLEIQHPDGTHGFQLTSTGAANINGSANINLQIGSLTKFSISDNTMVLTGAAAGLIAIANNGVTDASLAFTVRGSENTKTSGAPVGGAYNVAGGNCSGSHAGTNIGGVLNMQGGDATVATTKVGGAANLRPGSGDTGGVMSFMNGAGTNRIQINDTGIGLFAAPPVAQPSGTGETVGFTAGAGTAVNDDSTFTGNVGATAYRISDVVQALKNLGVLAQ